MTAAALLVCSTAAGVIVLLGAVAGTVLAVLGVVGCWWAWRHRRTWREEIRTWLSAVDHPTAARRITPHQAAALPGHTRPGHAPSDQLMPPGLHSGEPLESVPTARLRVVWQRSYWQLRELPAGAARCEAVRLRHRVLDELERRDPAGFGRWLQADPRAGSDPGRYLRVDR